MITIFDLKGSIDDYILHTIEGANLSSKKVQNFVNQNFGVELSHATSHRLLKNLGFSYITPRPSHYKADSLKKEEFKKNLEQEVGKDKDREVFFFDESRFGTHSRAGHGWFKTGSRTPIKIKLGFKNFYLYTDVPHTDDKNFD